MGAERLYVVVPANHRFGAKRRKDLSAFAEVQWHSFPTNRNALEFCGSLLESQLAAGEVVYPQITTVDSLTAQKRLVEAGFGIALMPRRNVSDELTRGTLRLVEIGSVEAQLPIVLVRCRGGPQENALEAFVATLQDRMPALFDN